MSKPLEQHSIDKCLMGIVQSLDDIFEGYAYCRDQHLGPGKGTRSIHPPGYFFFASEAEPIKTWGYDLRQPGGNMKQGLYAKPRPHVRKLIESRCTPRISRGADYDEATDLLGSFRIIAWEPYGHALVVATDVNHIANLWVAFVPLDTLPVIDLTTVEIYQP